jgi:hypothetical protein
MDRLVGREGGARRMTIGSPSLAGYAGLGNLSPAGRTALVDVANQLGTDPDWLGAVFQFESGFRKDATNAMSGAYSYIQFMPSTLANLGTSKQAISQMADADVIRGPVLDYFKRFSGQLHSLDDTYLAVFYPAAIGKPDDYVVGPPGSAVYNQNAGFDRTGKGYITKSDIVQTIRGVYNAAQGASRIPVAGIASALTTWLILAGLAMGTAGAVMYTWSAKL